MTGLSSRGVPDGVIRHCTRRAFTNLVDLAIRQDVAFVIIAGDLYDGDWRDYSTGLFFANEMRRLDRPCFLVRGNHDARSVITKNLVAPPNVHEFSARRTETVELADLGIALHGRSFPDRAVPEDLSAEYPPPVPGRFNIGILHTSAEDRGEHETYAPCQVSGLVAKAYDYWALGHIHQRKVLAPGIIFPGNIQGRSVRETGPKGCSVIEVTDRRIVGIQHHDLDVLRWAALSVAVDGASGMADIASRLRDALSEAVATADGRPLIARVTLLGATACHAELAAEPSSVDAECRNAAAAVSGDLYIERVRIETSLPTVVSQADGAASDLQSAFVAAVDDPDIVRELLKDFAGINAKMPVAAKTRPPVTEAALRALVPDAWHIVAQALREPVA